MATNEIVTILIIGGIAIGGLFAYNQGYLCQFSPSLCPAQTPGNWTPQDSGRQGRIHRFPVGGHNVGGHYIQDQSSVVGGYGDDGYGDDGYGDDYGYESNAAHISIA